MATSYSNFIYNAERGFIFAYVPKVACTNWKAVMRQMQGYADWLDPKLAHDRQKSGLRILDASGPERSIILDPGIKKYTMVRNPYTRLLSAYLNKFESRRDAPETARPHDLFDEIARAIDRYRREALGAQDYPEVNFEVFLRWIVNKEKHTPPLHYMRSNEHWASQVDLLLWPQIEFDIVGRFENLAEDADRILNAMGSSVKFPTQSDVRFSPTGAKDRLSHYLTPTCAALIAEIFSEDFRNFSYEK